MNTKNNRRRRESVERIEREFIELLQTRELGEISVSELCKRCGINRTTFYANFDDIYALADKLKSDLEAEVFALYRPEFEGRFNSHDYLKLFRHMAENRLFYLTYFKLGYDEKHAVSLYDTALAERDFGGRHIDYHIAFFRSGFNAIVKMWLERGCAESPEEMQEILRAEYRGRGD